MIDCLFNKRDLAQVIKLGLLFHQGRDGWASELVAFRYWVVLVMDIRCGRGQKREPGLLNPFIELFLRTLLF